MNLLSRNEKEREKEYKGKRAFKERRFQIEIAKGFTKDPIERDFIKGLSRVKSNVKEFENGKDIYLKKMLKSRNT